MMTLLILSVKVIFLISLNVPIRACYSHFTHTLRLKCVIENHQYAIQFSNRLKIGQSQWRKQECLWGLKGHSFYKNHC